MCEQLEGQLTWSDLGISFGKMSLDASHRDLQRAETSKQYSKKSAKSSAKKLPLFLFLKMDGLKPGASAEWVTAAAPFPSLGDFTMLSTGEYPREENASRLSQILEDFQHQTSFSSEEDYQRYMSRYHLSARACAGILNRAQKRGKELPPELKEALLRQCGSGGCVQPDD